VVNDNGSSSALTFPKCASSLRQPSVQGWCARIALSVVVMSVIAALPGLHIEPNPHTQRDKRNANAGVHDEFFHRIASK
jgi:hypothetical protein